MLCGNSKSVKLNIVITIYVRMSLRVLEQNNDLVTSYGPTSGGFGSVVASIGIPFVYLAIHSQLTQKARQRTSCREDNERPTPEDHRSFTREQSLCIECAEQTSLCVCCRRGRTLRAQRICHDDCVDERTGKSSNLITGSSVSCSGRQRCTYQHLRSAQ